MDQLQLLRIVRHVDLPNHALAERLARFAVFYGTVIPPLSTVVVVFLLTHYLMPNRSSLQLILLAVVVGVWLLNFICIHVLNNIGKWAAVFAAIGALIGAAMGYMEGTKSAPADDSELAIAILVYGGIGAIAGVFGVHASMLIHLANTVIQLIGSPLSRSVNTVFAGISNFLLKRKCPVWIHKDKKKWNLRFNHRGIAIVGHGGGKIYVANPKLRRNGLATAAGIPLFTWAMLVNEPGMVVSAMQQAFGDSSTDFGGNMDIASLPAINPATGLPMMGDGIGGFDVAGNVYGQNSMHDMGADYGSSMNYGAIDHHT